MTSSVRISFAYVATLCLLLVSKVAAKDTLLTFELPAGAEHCFYEDAQNGKTIELDWDIIAGASDGESALDVQMFDANGRDVQVPQTGGHNFFEFVTQADGAVRLCFRNRQGFGNNMWVYFELAYDRAGDNDDDFDFLKELHGSDAPKAENKEVSEKLEAMKNQALHVHQQFTSVIRTQNYLRYREARHRNTAESNHDRVLYWSLFQCAVMISCACVQVFFVRRFFAEPQKGSGRINF